MRRDAAGEVAVPEHVAVIMDGNGRWAAKRRVSKAAGHRAGAQALRKLATEAEKMGVRYLTVYAFSTENWKRPRGEVESLMRLLRDYIQQYMDDTKKNDMRISAIGDISRLEPDLRQKIIDLETMTVSKPGLRVIIAINYGGRDEIVRAARHIAQQAAKGVLPPGGIDEEYFSGQLDTSGIPEPELLVRTGGEMRLSNFMLWQLAYTELYVTDKLWPDFTADDLTEAFIWYGNRRRNFGARPKK